MPARPMAKARLFLKLAFGPSLWRGGVVFVFVAGCGCGDLTWMASCGDMELAGAVFMVGSASWTGTFSGLACSTWVSPKSLSLFCSVALC